MCLVALALQQHSRFPLVLASNRDEFLARAAAPLDWWRASGEGADILGGRDLQAGGTWLGLSRAGRLALVTNVREPGHHDPNAPSRGALVTDWLASDEDFPAHWSRLAQAGHNGFNLMAADLAQGHWYCAGRRAGRADAQPLRLGPGIYGLSNAALDTPWPKTEALKAHLTSALAETNSTVTELAARLFEALADSRTAPEAALPHTGMPLAWERGLSAAFIRLPEHAYGTRCSTLVITERLPDASLQTLVLERTHDGAVVSERRERLLGWPPVGAQAGLERSP